MAEFKKGQTPWNKGIKGEDSHMFNQKHSLGCSAWNKGQKQSLETRKKISLSKGGIFGMYNTPFYNTWRGMKQRCQDSNSPNYKRYGRRGITICNDWQLFKGFYKDMFSSYKEGLTIDRINNNGSYYKENCRWATKKQQAENRSNTHLFEYKGIADTLTNWANYFKIKRSTLTMRIYKYHWDMEKALFTPIRKRGVSYR